MSYGSETERDKALNWLSFLRLLALCVAVILLAAEIWRSAALARHWLLIAEDIFAALCLLLAAGLIYKDTPRRRAGLATAWTLNATLLYISFHTQWFRDADALTTGLSGLSLVDYAVAGLLALCLIGLGLTLGFSLDAPNSASDRSESGPR